MRKRYFGWYVVICMFWMMRGCVGRRFNQHCRINVRAAYAIQHNPTVRCICGFALRPVRTHRTYTEMRSMRIELLAVGCFLCSSLSSVRGKETGNYKKKGSWCVWIAWDGAVFSLFEAFGNGSMAMADLWTGTKLANSFCVFVWTEHGIA